MTLHRLNKINRAWMELDPFATDRKKLEVFALMRETPTKYLSGSLKYGFGIIVNGMPLWAEARPVAEAIEAAKEMGIQTRFAWDAPKWIELEAKQ